MGTKLEMMTVVHLLQEGPRTLYPLAQYLAPLEAPLDSKCDPVDQWDMLH